MYTVRIHGRNSITDAMYGMCLCCPDYTTADAWLEHVLEKSTGIVAWEIRGPDGVEESSFKRDGSTMDHFPEAKETIMVKWEAPNGK